MIARGATPVSATRMVNENALSTKKSQTPYFGVPARKMVVAGKK